VGRTPYKLRIHDSEGISSVSDVFKHGLVMDASLYWRAS
ncbi:unnamed protein product, partial [Oikopleura dioica]